MSAMKIVRSTYSQVIDVPMLEYTCEFIRIGGKIRMREISVHNSHAICYVMSRDQITLRILYGIEMARSYISGHAYNSKF